MLVDSELPKTLWAEVLATATYIYNRSPHSAIGFRTPFEQYYKKIPHIGHLRIFGGMVYCHIPKETGRKKLDDRAYKGYLVGYGGTHQYRIWNPTSKKLLLVRDARFSEEENFGSKTIQFESDMPIPVKVEIHEKDESIQDKSDSSSESSSSDDDDDDAENEGSDDELGQDIHTQPIAKPVPAIKQATTKRAIGLRSRTVGSPDELAGYAFIAGQLVEPETYKQATHSLQSKEWLKAMDEEYKSLIDNKTWELQLLPRGREALTGRWLYKIKYATDGTIKKFKARWVARGFEQQYGIDYNESFAPVVKPMTYRTLFAIAAAEDLEIEQMDVKTAFLNGHLEEEVYMEQPTGFDDNTTRVCKLNKVLYGLKQAPRVWYLELAGFLNSIGYCRLESDFSVFYHKGMRLWIAIFVDDLLIIGKDKIAIKKLKSQLSQKYEMTDLGPCAHYLGMQIERDRQRKVIRIHQEKYINDILTKYQLDSGRCAATPMDNGLHLVRNHDTASPEDTRQYQSAVGSLMYLMICTRPDLAFAVSLVSRYASNPGSSHWITVKRIFRYLRGTTKLGLMYRSDGPYIGYSDADWASNTEDRRSTGGYVFILHSSPISWMSKRQSAVATSSCEAEYMALCQTVKEAVWLRKLLQELNQNQYTTEATSLLADNMGAIALAKNPEFHARTKHIDIAYHFIREKIADSTVTVEWIPTTKMVADGLIKALPAPKFKEFISSLGLTNSL